MNTSTKRYYIYSLEYPVGEIRYIGKTCDPTKRLHKHLTKIKRVYGEGHVSFWIMDLLDRGVRPVMKTLAVFDSEEEAFRNEVLAIAYYRSLGMKLCNKADGGEGNKGCTRSLEQRLKISEACKNRKRPDFKDRRPPRIAKGGGHPQSLESKLKIGAGNKGKIKSPESRKLMSVARRIFTDDQVKEIVELKKTMSFTELQAKFNCSRCALQRAVHSVYNFPPA